MSTALEKQSDRDISTTPVERTRSRPYVPPPVDIFELPGELTLVADMPGVESHGIDIHFENGTLSITGKVDDRQPAGARYLWREYALTDYYRTFQVSEVIDTEHITAEYSDGQLTLHLPKVAAAQPRKIKVNVK